MLNSDFYLPAYTPLAKQDKSVKPSNLVPSRLGVSGTSSEILVQSGSPNQLESGSPNQLESGSQNQLNQALNFAIRLHLISPIFVLEIFS